MAVLMMLMVNVPGAKELQQNHDAVLSRFREKHTSMGLFLVWRPNERDQAAVSLWPTSPRKDAVQRTGAWFWLLCSNFI